MADNLRACLLINGTKIKKWQHQALDMLGSKVEVVVIFSSKPPQKKILFKNILYYVYRIVINRLTLFSDKSIGRNYLVRDLDLIPDGNWLRFSKSSIDAIKQEKLDIMIKFSSDLLKVPDELCDVPIFSYHHGDPKKYRGRPACFHELINGEPTCSAIVQTINNTLDGGKVFAMCKTRVIPHSVLQTYSKLFGTSCHLLGVAIGNWENDLEIKTDKQGSLFTLPTNKAIIVLFFSLIIKKLKRYFYGMFVEKRWRIAISEEKIRVSSANILNPSEAKIPPVHTAKYTFYADPFYMKDGKGLRVEALNKFTGRGEIVELDKVDGRFKRELMIGEHYSFPFSFEKDGIEYLFPETANHIAQHAYVENDTCLIKSPMLGIENRRIVDTCVFEKDKAFYLFFSPAGELSDTVLELFYSDSLLGEYKRHPRSPVCIDVTMARMAGGIFVDGDKIYRFGQDNSNSYGNGIKICELIDLNEKNYEETVVGTIKVFNGKGPHCIDFDHETKSLVYDFYTEKFSLFSGYRRLMARL